MVNFETLEQVAPAAGDLPADLALEGISKLQELCRTQPAYLKEAITKAALPACLRHSSEFNDQYILLLTREAFGKWLQDLPTELFINVVEECHTILVHALSGESFEAANWTLTQIGYRTSRVVGALENYLSSKDEKKRLVALATLISLGGIEEKRSSYLEVAMVGFPETILPAHSAILPDLVDESSITLLRAAYLERPKEFAEKHQELLIAVTAGLAATTSSEAVHDLIADTLFRISGHCEGALEGAILIRGKLLQVINSQRVIQFLTRVISESTNASDKTSGHLRLALLRLADCYLPEHLRGCEEIDSASVVPCLKTVLLSDDHYVGRNSTPLNDLKLHAVEALLRFGRDELIDDTPDVIDGEKRHYTLFEFIETVSIFQFEQLPKKIKEYITEKKNLEKEQDSELILRLSASRLARSTATREAFETLLKPGLQYAGSTMRDTVEALADVSLALARDEVNREYVVTSLLALLRRDVKEPQISGITRAINTIALSGYVADEYLAQLTDYLLNVAGDPDPFDGGQIVNALSGFNPELIPANIRDKLKEWARGQDNWLSWRSIEALINLGLFAENEAWLCPKIGLSRQNNEWRWQDGPAVSKWGSVYVVLLFGKDQDSFAQAVGDVLLDRNWEGSERATMTLAGVYENRRLPENSIIGEALVQRIKQRNRPNSADLAVFRYLPIIAPLTLAKTKWQEMWNNWTSSARAALGDAFGCLTSLAHQAEITAHLDVLLTDIHFGVRRSAARSLSEVNAEAATTVFSSLASSSDIKKRVRAAEMLPYIESDELPVLLQDEAKQVREASEKGMTARSQMLLAETLLGKVLSVRDPSNKEMLQVAKYAQALTKVGDDSTLSRLAENLSREIMPSRVRLLKSSLHKKLSQEWEKRRRNWPEPLSQVRGSITTGTGILEIGERTVAVRYELWLTSSEQSTDRFNWGGDLYLPISERDDHLMGASLVFVMDRDGARGEVHVGSTHFSSDADELKITVTGSGPFPGAG
jgi:hypothetical protein